MNRYTIHASVEIDINASNEEEAYEAFSDALTDIEGCRESIVHAVDTKERHYRHPPQGAGMWAAAARRIRLGEEMTWDEPKDIALKHDGSWWWSNGHVMVRCEGKAPEGFKTIPDDTAEAAFGLGDERVPTKWSRPLKTADSTVMARRSSANTEVAVQDRYYDLIASSLGFGGARWLVGKPHQPIHVRDIEERLMAVVMPIKTEGMEADPATLPNSVAPGDAPKEGT